MEAKEVENRDLVESLYKRLLSEADKYLGDAYLLQIGFIMENEGTAVFDIVWTKDYDEPYKLYKVNWELDYHRSIQLHEVDWMLAPPSIIIKHVFG